MRTTIRLISAACSATLLLACGSVATSPPAAPQSQAPETADRYYAQGRSQHVAQHYDEAMQSYRQALRLDPRHLNARNGMAVLYAGQGDYRKAIQLWQGIADQGLERAGPERAFLLTNLGYAYLLNGEPARALPVLERSCVLDPLNAQAWEHLGHALERLGQAERAALMLRQAQTLRSYDVRRDYALLPAGSVAPATARALAARGADGEGLTPDAQAQANAHTEITQARPAAVQVRRVDAAVPAEPKPAPAPMHAALPDPAPHGPARLEISNGNGVPGMAAALARMVQADDLTVVRLSNVRRFAVPVSRIEYRPERQAAAQALAARLGLQAVEEGGAGKRADVRVVLGHDQCDPSALKRRYLASAGAGQAAAILAAQ